MSNIRIAERYAKSLLDLAIEKNELEKVYAGMQWLQFLCKSNRDFVNMLRNPVIKGDIKTKIITAFTAEQTGQLTNTFLRLLIQKGREDVLPEITRTFINQYKTYKKILTVKLTTAIPLDDAWKNRIAERLKAVSGMESVELEAIVNPDIVGGFVLRSGDKLIDASVAYSLREIAKKFSRNEFRLD
jgi:F-type H+-transporting ATPase subunit delta